MAAHQAGSRAMIAYCLTAFGAETQWPTAVRAGLSTELHFLAVHPGYQETTVASPPHAVVSEAIAGGIYQLMRECILKHGPEQLPNLSPQVTFAALTPFIGAEAASSVAEQPLTG